MPPFNVLLKRARQQARMSQEALARAADLSLSAISKLEQADMGPSWATVQRIAKALGVSPLTFMEEEAAVAPGRPAKPPQARKGK